MHQLLQQYLVCSLLLVMYWHHEYVHNTDISNRPNLPKSKIESDITAAEKLDRYPDFACNPAILVFLVLAAGIYQINNLRPEALRHRFSTALPLKACLDHLKGKGILAFKLGTLRQLNRI